MLEELVLLKNDVISFEESIKGLSYDEGEEVYVMVYDSKENKYKTFKGVVVCNNKDKEPHPKYDYTVVCEDLPKPRTQFNTTEMSPLSGL